MGDLVDALDLSQPAVPQRRVCRPRAEPLADVDAWLAPYRKFWRGRRDSVEYNYENAAELRRRGEIPQAPADLPDFRS